MYQFFFDTGNFLKRQKSFLTNFFSDTISFRHLFLLPPLWSTEIFDRFHGQRQKFSEAPRTFHRQKDFVHNSPCPSPLYIVFWYQKLPETPENFRYCRTKNWIFCDTPSKAYQNFRARRISSAGFEVFSACSRCCKCIRSPASPLGSIFRALWNGDYPGLQNFKLTQFFVK